MPPIAYVNGTYLPEAEAKVSIFDRGFLFADGVYEVAAILEGKLVDQARHKWRLEKSLEELNMPLPLPWPEIEAMERELVQRNRLDQGLVYFQVTRGVADREFWHAPGLKPTLIAFTQARQLDPSPAAEAGVKVVTCPDWRWKRRDIKSVSLLAQVMAKQIAHQAGAFEALMVEEGQITEGASSSAFIVTDKDQLIVRPGGGPDILPGLTRMAMLELAQANGVQLVNRAFSPAELYSAKEAFLTAATLFVLPIIEADHRPIGAGKPGPLTQRLRHLLLEAARATLS